MKKVPLVLIFFLFTFFTNTTFSMKSKTIAELSIEHTQNSQSLKRSLFINNTIDEKIWRISETKTKIYHPYTNYEISIHIYIIKDETEKLFIKKVLKTGDSKIFNFSKSIKLLENIINRTKETNPNIEDWLKVACSDYPVFYSLWKSAIDEYFIKAKQQKTK